MQEASGDNLDKEAKAKKKKCARPFAVAELSRNKSSLPGWAQICTQHCVWVCRVFCVWPCQIWSRCRLSRLHNFFTFGV